MTLTRVVLVEHLSESVIGVRARENRNCEQICSKYKQLCDVCSQKKKKVGVVILKGSKGSWVYTYVYI